jgi:hypothetical protein
LRVGIISVSHKRQRIRGSRLARTTDSGATLLEEPIVWLVAALLGFLGLMVLDVIVKSVGQPAK